MCVTVAVRDQRRLEDDGTALHVHDREGVRVAVWVDTDDVVQLICEHPKTNLQPKRWGTRTGAGLGCNRGRQNCAGRAHNADRLLIRPASGRQAGTGPSDRTNHWKDTRERSHSRIESRPKSTETNLTNAPDGTTHTLTVRECPPKAALAKERFTASSRLASRPG